MLLSILTNFFLIVILVNLSIFIITFAYLEFSKQFESSLLTKSLT